MISTIIYTVLPLIAMVYVVILITSLITKRNDKVSSIQQLNLVRVYDTIIDGVKLGIITFENDTYSGFEVVLIKNNLKYIPIDKKKYSTIIIESENTELIPYTDENQYDDIYITVNEYILRKLCNKTYNTCEKIITFHLLKMYNDLDDADNYLEKEFYIN